MKKIYLLLPSLLLGSVLFAQHKKETQVIKPDDSTTMTTQKIGEVIIIGNPSSGVFKENKSLGSVDSYLETSDAINMIKRGAYAWEPMLNGMSTERSVITIDGMRIFNACTDKMDPITSYVENTNLSSAHIEEGQSGSVHGATIAGSIDLIRKKSGFKVQQQFGGAAFAGFESNNKQQIYGAALNYSNSKFFTDVDFTYRDAENYKAGKQSDESSEVDFSQFTKYNLSATTGFKINEKQSLEAALIYDKATDVGYPGLPMDVSLAEATIGSLQYSYQDLAQHLHLWETKVYFNTIKHFMDDSPRPVVPIRMDMPGWSKTQGFYSKLLGSYKKHSFRATFSGYLNNALAEMTMFPNDPNEKDMFMLTWPDVNTLYSGINVEDNIYFNSHLSLHIQGGIGVHHNEIKSELGLNSLQLFYPDLTTTKTRLLKNLSTQLAYHHGNFIHQLGFGYGDRAPTVSEAYGFYLLNVNDNYDYVGNPYMVNEQSLNIDASSSFKKEKFTIKGKVNYFHLMNYIIAKPRTGMPSMNITAAGIKVYEQLKHASIFNASLGMDYFPIDALTLSGHASYRYGQGAGEVVLPLIQPFSYKLKAKYEYDSFFAEISVVGSSKNRNSIEFGETQKPAYAIVNIALSKHFSIQKQHLIFKLGVENLFDHYYSTFDDWFGIPSMGRNIYANVVFRF